MRALVLDGGHGGDTLTASARQAVEGTLREAGFECETLVLRDKTIAPCRGCFGCWTRTPGECVICDDATEVVEAYLRADAVVYVTPVTFGGYSSELKKALDRIIPVLDPRFTIVHGEVHHKLRYERYPDLFALGTLESPDAEAEAVFAQLVVRNGLNTHKRATSAVVARDEDVAAATRLLLSRTEVAA